MKKTALLLSILVFLLSGCDMYRMLERYPNNKADVWYCAEIDATIDFSTKASLPNTIFSWDGVVYRCRAVFQAGLIVFSYDANQDGTIKVPDELLLDGRWKYKEKNIVIEITSSSLLGDTFTELTFVPIMERGDGSLVS